MPNNILHNPLPDAPVAQWSPVDGRAVIEMPNGKVYVLDPSKPAPVRLNEARIGFHAGMFLQPALAAQVSKPVVTCAAGEYPFTELRKKIDFQLSVYDALDAFLHSLDTDLDVEMRQKDARKATRLLEDDALRAAVGPVLLSQPLDKSWDITHGPTSGKAGEILKRLIAARGA